jgi:hypothetical protein
MTYAVATSGRDIGYLNADSEVFAAAMVTMRRSLEASP